MAAARPSAFFVLFYRNFLNLNLGVNLNVECCLSFSAFRGFRGNVIILGFSSSGACYQHIS